MENDKRARNQCPDRLRISAEALTRLNCFIEQVSERLRGVKVTRSELVNFLIMDRPEALSASELKGLESKYFDEVKFAQWAVEELKAAKVRGESSTLAEILAKHKGSPPVQRRPQKKASQQHGNE